MQHTDKDCMMQRARVQSISGGKIVVTVMQASACMGCHAAGSCSVLDKKPRSMEVNMPSGGQFQLGEEVMLKGAYSIGRRAIFAVFIVPLILLLAAAFIALSALEWSEPNAIFLSLGVIVVYYLLLIPFRGYFEKKLSFTIEKIAPHNSVEADS